MNKKLVLLASALLVVVMLSGCAYYDGYGGYYDGSSYGYYGYPYGHDGYYRHHGYPYRHHDRHRDRDDFYRRY